MNTKPSDKRTPGGTEVCVKKEEMLDPNLYNHKGNDKNRPEISIKEEERDSEDYLCKTLGCSS